MTVNKTRLTLLGRLQKGGSDRDWEEFNTFYHGLVKSWARHFGCPESVVEDIYQNTLIAVLPALPRFEHTGRPGCFRSWLKTIVQRRVYDYFRREMKHAPKKKDDAANSGITSKTWTPPPDEQPDPDGETREAEMDRIWLRELMGIALNAARDRVKPEKYESFRRYVIYQEPVSVVSQQMGIRVGTIFQHKSSFLDVLREEFIRLLEGLNDLGPGVSSDVQARKHLKQVLEDFIQCRKDVRNTMVADHVPASEDATVGMVRNIVNGDPMPDSGTFILWIRPDGSHTWIRFSDAVSIGSAESNDIIIDHDGASASHAEIREEDGKVVACDTNSMNGLFLNNRRIGEWELQPGDCLQVTDHYLIYLENNELVDA